nr:hypothetical protein [Micromonospora sp. DSM 115978]
MSRAAPLPPLPSPFLLVEPLDQDRTGEHGDHRAIGWGLESTTEAVVYFKHPEQEIREVGVFLTAEQAQSYYSDWGELDLLRPARSHGWPAPTEALPADRSRRPEVEPIWQARQWPGAQLVHLYSPEP